MKQLLLILILIILGCVLSCNIRSPLVIDPYDYNPNSIGYCEGTNDWYLLYNCNKCHD